MSGPFVGLAWPFVVLFTVALAVVLVNVCDLALLAWWGAKARRRADELGEPADVAREMTWVFLVPALDEEAVIADSVGRLLALDLPRRVILIIDDGSTDRTPEILAGINHPDLVIFRRDPPEARHGKAAALNAAWRHLATVETAPGGHLAGVDLMDVVVVVVDADGRLDANAPAVAAAHFEDDAVGGVQLLVRIYNRDRSLLVRLQDMEFGVFGGLLQLGRTTPGTAGLGGNGQFTRARALADVADEQGPWRDKLTEDQDLGLRLLMAGWRIHQDVRAAVNQQGLANLRRLWRQRTRWAQGNLQALSKIKVLRAPGISFVARCDLAVYLYQPVQQTVMGVAFLVAIVLAIFAGVPFWGQGDWWYIAFTFCIALAFLVVGAVAYARVAGLRAGMLIVVLGVAYALYSWLLWPALSRAWARQVLRRGGWAKTQREVVVPAPEEIESGAPPAPAGETPDAAAPAAAASAPGRAEALPATGTPDAGTARAAAQVPRPAPPGP